MATITAPSPQEVLDHANVTPAMLGKEPDDTAGVKRDIANLILPGVLARVEVKADEAASPYDYPLTTSIMARAYRSDSSEQRQERATKQADMLRLAVLNYAAAALHLRVRRPAQANFSSETSADKAKEYERNGDTMLEAATGSIKTAASKAQGSDSTASAAANNALRERRRRDARLTSSTVTSALDW